MVSCQKEKSFTDNSSWVPKDTVYTSEFQTVIFPNQMTKIIAPDTFQSYLWSTGSTSSYLFTNQAGLYTCACTDHNLNVINLRFYIFFGKITKNIPTFFSPNGDGANDYWCPFYEVYQHIEIKVFDLNNNLVFKFDGNTELPNSCWSGKDLNGNLVPNGQYYYYIKLDTTDKNSPVYTGYLLIIH